MSPVVISVFLSAVLGPGLGQLYNGDRRKGWLLIVVTLLIAGFLFIYPASQINFQELANIESLDYSAIERLSDQAKKEFWDEHFALYSSLVVLLLGLWIFGVVDAYRAAKRKITNGGTV